MSDFSRRELLRTLLGEPRTPSPPQVAVRLSDLPSWPTERLDELRPRVRPGNQLRRVGEKVWRLKPLAPPLLVADGAERAAMLLRCDGQRTIDALIADSAKPEAARSWLVSLIVACILIPADGPEPTDQGESP
jgi:hypothetical protein